MHAEFLALGFVVHSVDGVAAGEQERRIELGVVAEANDADCAVSIARQVDSELVEVELWINDRRTGRPDFRQMPVPGGSPGEAAATIALRVVEVLKAKIHLALPAEPPTSAANATPVAAETPSEPVVIEDAGPTVAGEGAARLGLRLGPGMAVSPGGLSPSLSLLLGARWHVAPPFSAELEGGLTVLGRELRHQGSAASFHWASARAWLLWQMLSRGALRAAVGPGVGAMVFWSRGLSSPRLVAARDAAATLYAGATAQMAISLTSLLRIRGGVHAGLLLPEIGLRYGDEADVGTFGRPLVETFVAVEAVLD